MMKKHFVRFFSPGTFVAESSTIEIDSWDVDEAKKLARNITERHGATPYGFQFETYGREDNELDSKRIDHSSMYYLGGTVSTLEEVKARNDPKDKILISNMENNEYDRIIINNNSYSWCQPLRKDDVVLDWTP